MESVHTERNKHMSKTHVLNTENYISAFSSTTIYQTTERYGHFWGLCLSHAEEKATFFSSSSFFLILHVRTISACRMLTDTQQEMPKASRE